MKGPNFNRRSFIRNTGFGLLAFNVAGVEALLTPRDAYARQIPLTVLSDAQASLLGEFGESLLPGARAAGLVHFVDLQLSRDPQECLLMCKYFPGIDPPYAEFYGGGLEGLNNACEAVYGQDFGTLGDPQRNQLIDTLWSDEVAGWTGPPARLFYMMVRSDAVDVVYGSKDGFAELNIPYMEHILPPEKW